MDAVLPLSHGGVRLEAANVRRFYEGYLFRDVGAREHVTAVFHDFPLPSALLEGLRAIDWTRVVLFDMRTSRDQVAALEPLWNPRERYISIHDFTSSSFPTGKQQAARLANFGKSVDYTSFEFPRFGLTPAQVETLLAIVVNGDQDEEVRRAHRFFQHLCVSSPYTVRIRTGADRELTVSGSAPWMQLCGRLVEGEVRFSPGCELFYAHHQVNGVLRCGDGINFLPLRGAAFDVAQCRAIVELGSRLVDDPIDIFVRDGQIVELASRGSLASELEQALAFDEAFRTVVEVGIGLRDSARPLITSWAAPSNEAVPGVHLGIGADPSNPSRFETKLHFDFVVPGAIIEVNGRPYYDGRRFCD